MDVGRSNSDHHLTGIIFPPLTIVTCDLQKVATHKKTELEFLKMNGIIYLVGLVVVVLAILSFLGLH